MKHQKTAALALILLSSSAQAGTVTWGGGFASTNYNASGNQLQSEATAAQAAGTVMFELGIFQNADGSEFTPTFGNVADWQARFVPLSDNDTQAPLSSYTDPGNTSRGFGGQVEIGATAGQVQTAETANTGGTLVEGYQVYLWGYDSKLIDETAQPEWFLATGTGTGQNDDWTLPDSDESNNGTFEKTWDIASATTAIVGQIDDNQGGGELMQPGQNFENSDLQFATIPEPSSALLILLSATALLRRRR